MKRTLIFFGILCMIFFLLFSSYNFSKLPSLFFQGHFPGNPVMPGVLQIEAMAQTAGALVISGMENYKEMKAGVFFMSIDGVKFRKPVKPGDQLKMHVEKIKERRNIFVFKGQSMVDGQVVSEAEFTAMIVE